ncbi:hypothetical protein [Zavarzinella formosa]|uniref:hypothetical protein n=1 Tax=Zavarzinella formosa TaxID=360055 RepID=UPI00030534D3|nr:hypothetical protein [Zavarzinella formosa]
MFRALSVSALALSIVAVAQGHFAFIVPEKSGGTAQVVFSDDLGPDENVPIEKLNGMKLHLRADGKLTPLTWKAEKHSLVATVSGSGNRVLVGHVDYGVMQKGDAKPYLLRYEPKAVIGDPFAGKADEKATLEVAATGKAGELKFVVTAAGKPVAEAEVNVMLPDGTKQKVKTNKEGTTPAFAAAGRYGLWTKISEQTAGELGGKKYEEVRTYATLVIDAPASGK